MHFKGWPAQTLGWLLMVVTLADVYLTVLYARTGVGTIAPWLTEWVWRGHRALARRLPGRWRDCVLSLAGPNVLVVLGAAWVGLMAVGFALVYWPMLGSKLKTQGAPTPTGFGTAFYYSLTTNTSVGSGSSIIEAGAPQFIVAVQSALGIAVVTLTITYFVQIYNAILERNALALKLHHASASTGDAAYVVAGLGSGGDFEGARGTLAEWAGELTKLFESHHLYSVLHVFRFTEPYYAASRIILLVMESMTFIRSALDEEEYAALRGSAGVTMLWGTGLQTMTDLAGLIIPHDIPEDRDLDPETLRQWTRRYGEAARVLREAGIKLAPDEAGLAAYVALRRIWDPYMEGFAHYMAQTVRVVDPAGAAA